MFALEAALLTVSVIFEGFFLSSFGAEPRVGGMRGSPGKGFEAPPKPGRLVGLILPQRRVPIRIPTGPRTIPYTQGSICKRSSVPLNRDRKQIEWIFHSV